MGGGSQSSNPSPMTPINPSSLGTMSAAPIPMQGQAGGPSLLTPSGNTLMSPAGTPTPQTGMQQAGSAMQGIAGALSPLAAGGAPPASAPHPAQAAHPATGGQFAGFGSPQSPVVSQVGLLGAQSGPSKSALPALSSLWGAK